MILELGNIWKEYKIRKEVNKNMSDLRNHYQTILKDLENYFQNEEDKQFVTEKFQELSIMFMDIIDRLTYLTDKKVQEMEERQKVIEQKINNVQKAVDGIESDIYEDEEGYEFEIVCPYCNHEFVTDINNESNAEVECPECHNIIELDWNEEEDCDLEDCSSCSHHCEELDDDININDDDTNINIEDDADEIVYDDDLEDHDLEKDDLEMEDDEEELVIHMPQRKSKKANKQALNHNEKDNKSEDKENQEDEDDDM